RPPPCFDDVIDVDEVPESIQTALHLDGGAGKSLCQVNADHTLSQIAHVLPGTVDVEHAQYHYWQLRRVHPQVAFRSQFPHSVARQRGARASLGDRTIFDRAVHRHGARVHNAFGLVLESIADEVERRDGVLLQIRYRIVEADLPG